jgi:hypothetical protein
MDTKQALKLIQDSFDSMQRSGMLDNLVVTNSETVILGAGSPLDSLGFVTFISDMEERISAATGHDHYLDLAEIQEFNIDQSILSAGTLAQYITEIAE